MLIRLIDIILILALFGGALYYLVYNYIVVPQRKQQQEIVSTTETAIDKAKIDYLEARKSWIGYTLQETPETFATYMDDMSIPAVARFQKIMVSLNQKYGDLTKGEKVDESFVGQATALKLALDSAIIAAKKKDLSA